LILIEKPCAPQSKTGKMAPPDRQPGNQRNTALLFAIAKPDIKAVMPEAGH
jgi:hypothetical protein